MGSGDLVRAMAMRPRRRRIAGSTESVTNGDLPCAIRVAAFASPDLDGLGRRLGFPIAVIAAIKAPWMPGSPA